MRFHANHDRPPGKMIAHGLHVHWELLFMPPPCPSYLRRNSPTRTRGRTSSHQAFTSKQRREQGTKLIVVDPRRTELVARGLQHLQCSVPGEDSAVLAGMLHSI